MFGLRITKHLMFSSKARRSWRAFLCAATLHSAAPSTNADRAEGLVMSEQKRKSFWLNGNLLTAILWRARIVRTKRGAWHCGVEKMQRKQGSVAGIWKLLLR